jgi:hypothetical protein
VAGRTSFGELEKLMTPSPPKSIDTRAKSARRR